mmetsp:Transcript_36973/g.87491  ORF Transcript_36973/g.87491 Transcript_36973/m.87491 type:complete len:205 (+) Transcript_36973:611-1225(+)
MLSMSARWRVTARHAPANCSSDASTNVCRSWRRWRPWAPRVPRMEARYCTSVASCTRPDGESAGRARIRSLYSTTSAPPIRETQCCMNFSPSSPPASSWAPDGSSCSGREKRCSAIAVTYGSGDDENEGAYAEPFLCSAQTRSFGNSSSCFFTRLSAASTRNSSAFDLSAWRREGARTRAMKSRRSALLSRFSNAANLAASDWR